MRYYYLMLTPHDLSRIKLIIEDVLEEKLEQKLETKLEQKLEAKIKPIRRDIKKLHQMVEDDFNFHEKNFLDHEKRLRRLETRFATDQLAS